MTKPTQVPVYTEPELEHVTILHVLQRVLVRTIRLLALPVLGVKPTRGHARLVELMQESARVSFHAQVSQPVPADRLSVILTSAFIELRGRGLRLRVVRVELILKVKVQVRVVVHGVKRVAECGVEFAIADPQIRHSTTQFLRNARRRGRRHATIGAHRIREWFRGPETRVGESIVRRVRREGVESNQIRATERVDHRGRSRLRRRCERVVRWEHDIIDR